MRERRSAAAAAVLIVLTSGCAGPEVDPGVDPLAGQRQRPTAPVLAVAPGGSASTGPAPALPEPKAVGSLVLKMRPRLDNRRVEWVRRVEGPAAVPSYELSDRLPDVTARADRLARALGLDPAARTGHGPTLRYEGAADAVLVVSTRDGQQWTYARDGADCTDVDGTEDVTILSECARTSDEGDGYDDPRHSPVTVGEARTAATPVLDALGVDVGAVTPTTGWGATLLSVDPSVQGRPTVGLATGVLVDRLGVRAATGWLGSATVGPSYDVRLLTDLVMPDGAVVGTARCPSEVPEGVMLPEECSTPVVRVRHPRLGYVPWRFADRLHLVPAWLGDDDRGLLVGVLPAVPETFLPESLRQRFSDHRAAP